MDRLRQYKHDYIIAHSTDINNYIDEQVSYHITRGFIPTLEELCEDIEREFDITGSGSESKTVYAIAKHIQNKCSAVIDYDMFESIERHIKLRINEKISDKDYSQSVTGKAYKVFTVKNGKLYPPMVANRGGSATPIGVWLDAESGDFVELDGVKRVVQSGVKGDTLRKRIANLDNLSPEDRRAEIKKIKNSTLAYRPGWHLGDVPRGPQFDRSATWEIIDELPDGEESSGNVTNESTLAKKATKTNIGKYYYVKSLDAYAYIFSDGVYLPYDFVWAECDYVADIDYQDEAMSYGYRNGKKFQHSLAGLPRVPEGGSYKYRTNPRPDTVPWVITGAMKVTKLLDDFDVERICAKNGVKAPERQGGNKTLEELGL